MTRVGVCVCETVSQSLRAQRYIFQCSHNSICSRESRRHLEKNNCLTLVCEPSLLLLYFSIHTSTLYFPNFPVLVKAILCSFLLFSLSQFTASKKVNKDRGSLFEDGRKEKKNTEIWLYLELVFLFISFFSRVTSSPYSLIFPLQLLKGTAAAALGICFTQAENWK